MGFVLEWKARLVEEFWLADARKAENLSVLLRSKTVGVRDKFH